MHNFLLLSGGFMGVISSIFWFFSAFAGVSREAAVRRKEREAKRRGEAPDLSGVSIGGMDLESSMRRQSTLNAAAAALAGLAIISQTASSFVAADQCQPSCPAISARS